MVDRLAKKHLVHLYTGDGKGKTTAAIGQVVRASGRGLSCVIIQFMKAKIESGELKALAALDNISIERHGLNMIGSAAASPAAVRESLMPALAAAKDAVGGRFDVAVLDEIITAMAAGALREDEVIDIIRVRAETVELILTGRGASRRLIDEADLVTEMKSVKHPYDQGVKARPGIEF